jgi:hypothetical protein
MTERETALSSPGDPFSIEIGFSHPTFDPLGISAQLSVEPSLSWKRGARFGSIVKTSSRWYGQLATGTCAAEYEDALVKIASFLTQHDSFLAEFRNGGGEIEIVLNHPAIVEPRGIAFDLQLSPIFLAHLSSRNIALHLRAWSDNPSWSSQSAGRTRE